jgi:hypothetical protein
MKWWVEGTVEGTCRLCGTKVPHGDLDENGRMLCSGCRRFRPDWLGTGELSAAACSDMEYDGTFTRGFWDNAVRAMEAE